MRTSAPVRRAEDSIVVCEQCGLAHRWMTPGRGLIARCSRCEASLGRGHRLGFDTVLALTITALVVYGFAMMTSVLTLRLGSNVVTSTLPVAMVRAWNDGDALVALTAGFTSVVAPGIFIALRLYVLAPLALGHLPPGFAWCVRVLHQAARWNMVEVFTVGALLSLVRLAGLADASPGPALYALGVLAALFAAIQSAGLKHLWWQLC